MASWRCAIFLANCQGISASRLNFVTPDGIGRSSSGFWKSIASAGSGQTPLHLTSETLHLSNSYHALQIFSICVCLAITQPNTMSMADTSIATKSCYGNAKLHLKAGRLRLSGIFPKSAMSGHSLAIISKDLRLKPASASPNVWGLRQACLRKRNKRPQRRNNRSSIFSYSSGSAQTARITRRWFSKMLIWRTPKAAIFSASLG